MALYKSFWSLFREISSLLLTENMKDLLIFQQKLDIWVKKIFELCAKEKQKWIG